ncbi:MAG: hypothetical protein ACH34X_03485 [Thiolinea sp.]
MVKSNNIILTGIPRSGTTLTCHLLNKLADCVALHEPIMPLELVPLARQAVVDHIVDFFAAQRQQIKNSGTAFSKSTGGKVPDNPMAGIDPRTGRRIRVLDGHVIHIDKELPADFYLVIKQPAFFTAILADLTQQASLSCFAVIRNPLSVLLSWNSVEMPVSRGRVPAAEAFSEGLVQLLDIEPDVINRQLILLNWFFEQYASYLKPQQILYYEKTVASKGQSLQCMVDSAKALNEPLKSQNANSLYSPALKLELAERLLAQANHAFRLFYTDEDILELARPS